MEHTLLVTAHAAGGALAFVAGCALLDAFCVVSAVDLHLPPVVVAVVAVVAAVPGVLLVRRAAGRERRTAVPG